VRRAGRRRGRAVQIDPIKCTLKVPGTNPLTLEYDEQLSTFAFKFNLRRYAAAAYRNDPTAGPLTPPL
jgi:hypothetical protein